MLEAAGCQLLTVHGRTREQKGPLTGVADWSIIRELRKHIKIPMFANGNILGLEDVVRCLEDTGVDGVMTAEGNLHNPALFSGQLAITWEMAEEYLNFVEVFPCPTSYIRGHLFKIFHHLMNLRPNADLREELAVANQVKQFRSVIAKIKSKYIPIHDGAEIFNKEEADPSVPVEPAESYNLHLPPWICQPYIRIPPEAHKQIIAEKVRIAEDPNTIKRQYYDNEGKEISRKRMKKLRRRMRRPNKGNTPEERSLEHCTDCMNPMGLKCVYRLCRICCREKCYTENKDCEGHGILIMSRREKAKNYEKNKFNCENANDLSEISEKQKNCEVLETMQWQASHTICEM